MVSLTQAMVVHLVCHFEAKLATNPERSGVTLTRQPHSWFQKLPVCQADRHIARWALIAVLAAISTYLFLLRPSASP
jgi:hypothetical protein